MTYQHRTVALSPQGVDRPEPTSPEPTIRLGGGRALNLRRERYPDLVVPMEDMPTIGWFSLMLPAEPKNDASP